MKEYQGVAEICPKCKEEHTFNYGSLEVDGEGAYYPIECTACGCTGKEWYSLNFECFTVDEDKGGGA